MECLKTIEENQKQLLNLLQSLIASKGVQEYEDEGMPDTVKTMEEMGNLCAQLSDSHFRKKNW